MYTSCTQEEVKKNIIQSFCSNTSHLRIVIATFAFIMGLDVPNVRQVLHWGHWMILNVTYRNLRGGGQGVMEICAVLFYIIQARTTDQLIKR